MFLFLRLADLPAPQEHVPRTRTCLQRLVHGKRLPQGVGHEISKRSGKCFLEVCSQRFIARGTYTEGLGQKLDLGVG